MLLFSYVTSGVICASRQLSASDVADCITSIDEMSLLSKTFALHAFHKNHMTHGVRARLSSVPLRIWIRFRIQSKFLYMEEHGNSPGCRGRCAKSQVYVAIGHSNSMWFTVSSSCPHLGQVRTGWQWRSARRRVRWVIFSPIWYLVQTLDYGISKNLFTRMINKKNWRKWEKYIQNCCSKKNTTIKIINRFRIGFVNTHTKINSIFRKN